MLVSHVILACIGGIILAILLYSFTDKVRAFFAHRAQKKRRIAIVQSITHAAMAQRSLMRMEVMQGDFQGFTAEGTCIAITQDHLILQVTDAFGAHQWLDVPLQIFFSIQQNGQTSFFHFVGMTFKSQRKGTLTELYVQTPANISPGQKRAFLRYAPPKPSILGMCMWLASNADPLPLSKSDIKKPFLLYRPNSQNDMVLDNISAGGLRVCIHERVMEQHLQKVKQSDRLLFLLVLANKQAKDSSAQPELKSAEEAKAENGATEKNSVGFWLSCRVITLIHIEKSNLWQVSMRFEKWAHLDEANPKIEWFPTDSNKSIPALSTWIMRTHMEQTKKI